MKVINSLRVLSLLDLLMKVDVDFLWTSLKLESYLLQQFKQGGIGVDPDAYISAPRRIPKCLISDNNIHILGWNKIGM